MPRTQATICGAPKAMAMPMMAPMHQPHDMRFAIAMAPGQREPLQYDEA